MASALNSGSRHKSALPKFLIAAIFTVIVVAVVYTIVGSGPWVVPEEAKQVKNPLPPSEDNINAARSVYRDKCADCHGDSGKGDGDRAKMHKPPPSDLTDAAHIDAETDGELFYKITHGHRPMPAFRKRLTDTQRWQLVLLIRFLARGTDKASAK